MIVEWFSTAIDYVKTKMVLILAIILIVSGVYDLSVVAENGFSAEMLFWNNTISAIIRIIVAEFMIFDPRKNVLRGIGFYAMSIGLSRFFTSLNALGQENTLSLVMGGVTLVMAVNMLISSRSYIKETTRGRFGMIMSSSGLSILQIVSLVMMYEAQNMGTTEVTFKELAPLVIGLFQYVVLLLLLDTSEARFSTLFEKVNTRMESIRVDNSLESHLQMPRSEAVALKHMFDDRTAWRSVDDSGPVECERCISIIKGRIPSCMILQKWKGSEKIFVTMTNDGSGSVILANRFSVSKVITDRADDLSFSEMKLFDDRSLIAKITVAPEVDG